MKHAYCLLDHSTMPPPPQPGPPEPLGDPGPFLITYLIVCIMLFGALGIYIFCNH